MLHITLHHMRTGWKRLLAAGIAIALGTGFIAATLLGGNAMREAAYQSFTAAYRGADLIVTSPVTLEAADDVAAAPGVQRTRIGNSVGAEAAGGDRTEFIGVGATTGVAADLIAPLASGTLPAATDEIALSESTADRLGVGVGDALTLTTYAAGADDAATTYTVTGLIAAGVNAFSMGPDALVSEDAFRASAALRSAGVDPLLIELSPGADLDTVRTELTALLDEDAPEADTSIMTRDELAEATTQMLTGDTQTITTLMLGFAGIALAVAALVIGNTFTVLVAQRTRLLALLRTIGASRRQIRTSVVQEAVLLGVVASAAGLALGYLIIAVAILAVAGSIPGIDLWAGVRLTAGITAATLGAGVVVTLVASWLPARAATLVSPLAAMRPVEVSIGTTAGRARAAIAALTFATGVGLLALGIILGHTTDAMGLALATGVLGGFVSVFGVLLGSVFVIRPLTSAVGAVFGRSSAARIAVTGAIRNPRRTASTTNALFIGVALVVMMSTGAASAKHTFDTELKNQFAVDVQVTTSSGESISDTQLQALQQVADVEVLTRVRTSAVTLATHDGGSYTLEAWAPESSVAGPAAGASAAGGSARSLTAGAALQDPATVDRLAGDEFVMSPEYADDLGLRAGAATPVTGPGGITADLRYAGPSPTWGLITTSAALLQVDPESAIGTVWIKLDPDANAIAAVENIQTVITDLSQSSVTDPVLMVEGGAIERATFTDVIDTMLLVVTALLGVAVVIALVGVANTLSLSVLERRRELATLRALGMTKTQVRSMLAMEGVIIAVTGAIFGAAGGLAYGWAGAYTVLSGLGQVSLALPWATLGLVIAVAILAGLLASVVPARSAVKVSPVAALAQE